MTVILKSVDDIIIMRYLTISVDKTTEYLNVGVRKLELNLTAILEVSTPDLWDSTSLKYSLMSL